MQVTAQTTLQAVMKEKMWGMNIWRNSKEERIQK